MSFFFIFYFNFFSNDILFSYKNLKTKNKFIINRKLKTLGIEKESIEFKHVLNRLILKGNSSSLFNESYFILEGRKLIEEAFKSHNSINLSSIFYSNDKSKMEIETLINNFNNNKQKNDLKLIQVKNENLMSLISNVKTCSGLLGILILK